MDIGGQMVEEEAKERKYALGTQQRIYFPSLYGNKSKHIRMSLPTYIDNPRGYSLAQYTASRNQRSKKSKRVSIYPISTSYPKKSSFSLSLSPSLCLPANFSKRLGASLTKLLRLLWVILIFWLREDFSSRWLLGEERRVWGLL